MKIEVFSDMVCPWCYIGKRRLRSALERLGEPADVVWRSFQLDPDYPGGVRWTLPEAHLNRYGVSRAENDRRLAMVTALAAREGLEYRLDRALVANTFDAHRLVHHAATRGAADDVVDRLMRAYAVEGRWIGDPATLAAIASEAGLPALPPGAAYAADVAADLARARELGVTGVPTVVIDGGYGLAGPDTDELIRAITACRT
ncbi:DsbA family protein [Streptomyces sp. 184]|uniref:DsbA family oxidoreductase n=1 Tax=Streptomyces sp. 184 TaxID=1827526 RepID=UPI0038911E06